MTLLGPATPRHSRRMRRLVAVRGGAQMGLKPLSGRALPEDSELVAQLRRGDEGAFAALFSHYHGALCRLARFYTPSQAVAEEVAQDTWAGVLAGLPRFEGRSSFKTW